jgi:hypothetical protein
MDAKALREKALQAALDWFRDSEFRHDYDGKDIDTLAEALLAFARDVVELIDDD